MSMEEYFSQNALRSQDSTLKKMAAVPTVKETYKWTAEQTRGLINFRVKHQDQFNKKHKYVSKKLWEIAVKQLGLEGIVTGVQAGKKWENLKMKYTRISNPRAGSVTDEGGFRPSDWRYFRDMHAALGGKPSIGLPGDPVPILMAMVVPQKTAEDAIAISTTTSTPAATAASSTTTPPPCKQPRHNNTVLDFFEAESLKEQGWLEEMGERASSGIKADHHPNEMELMLEDSGEMVWVTPTEGYGGMTTGANQTANQGQGEEEQDRLEIEHERALLDSERTLLEREREVLERERILLERERAGLHRELASLDRDRASLERDRATVERERAAVDWERAMLEKERARLDRDRLTMGIDAMTGRGVSSMVGGVSSIGVMNGRTNSVPPSPAATDGIRPAEVDPECVERKQKFMDLLENLLQKF
ncbi:uncharacterized protein LOC134464688 [Engraulis encrasicolus]|uniref:uncharacterized protein LOC134464688 n=1 Tax=Engraulis encrasicolus TaxID=184585 RepID=UPI002FD166B0